MSSSNKTKPMADAREYFSEEVRTVMDRQRVTAMDDSRTYLVDLLLRYMQTDVFFAKSADGKLENNVLAELYGAYMQASPEQKKITLRRLGDICLLVSGFFSESLKKKVVDVDYYHGMGGSAYHTLAQTHFNDLRSLYAELSQKFVTFSEVLSEISERSGIQTNSDLLRVYERFTMTGSKRLRTVLAEQGLIVPNNLDTKNRH